MRFTTSIIAASVATLAIAAPLKEKRQDLSSFLNSNSESSIDSLFSSNSLSLNDIAELLSGFDLNSFNSQFDSSFNDNNIEELLIELEGNSFGNSNLNSINDLSQFDLNGFANSFNSEFSASWSVSEIEQLLLELQLVDSSNLDSSNSFFNDSEFSNGFSNEDLLDSSDISSIETEIIAAFS
ncbi:hypothetical protein EG329_004606 [Mollisiaceae sp. DMI_Dod_QoI]|nr:hypothetical protein EG329_004606 [Helotiales sp. DMI_Dod_QoI]